VAGGRHTLHRGRRSEGLWLRRLPDRRNRALTLFFSRSSRQRGKDHGKNKQCAEKRPHRWIGWSPRFHGAFSEFQENVAQSFRHFGTGGRVTCLFF
jgi:hypothetical protein